MNWYCDYCGYTNVAGRLICRQCGHKPYTFTKLPSTVTIEVTFDLDAVPGWGYFGDDFLALVESTFASQVPHYNPKARMVRNSRPRPS